MNLNSLLITTVLTIIAPVITSILTFILKRLIDEKINTMRNEKLKVLLKEGTDIILDSVNYVQQTYVDTMKRQDFFDRDAQAEAFAMARERALELLPQEIFNTIEDRYGNVDTFVENIIESYIYKNKKEKEH